MRKRVMRKANLSIYTVGIIVIFAVAILSLGSFNKSKTSVTGFQTAAAKPLECTNKYWGDSICDDTLANCGYYSQSGISIDACAECTGLTPGFDKCVGKEDLSEAISYLVHDSEISAPLYSNAYTKQNLIVYKLADNNGVSYKSEYGFNSEKIIATIQVHGKPINKEEFISKVVDVNKKKGVPEPTDEGVVTNDDYKDDNGLICFNQRYDCVWVSGNILAELYIVGGVKYLKDSQKPLIDFYASNFHIIGQNTAGVYDQILKKYTAKYVPNYKSETALKPETGCIDIVATILVVTNYNKKLGDEGFKPEADFNGDEKVDIADIIIVATAAHANELELVAKALNSKEGDSEYNYAADYNKDKQVDIADLVLIALNVDVGKLKLVGKSFGTKSGETGYNELADYKKDGVIDIFDLVSIGLNEVKELNLVAQNFGAVKGSPNYNSNADYNKDGVIDSTDLVLASLKDMGKGQCNAKPTYMTEDLNKDGCIDIVDLVTVAKVFDTTEKSGDVNKDGKVDITDLVRIGLVFGEGCGAKLNPADVNGDGCVNREDVMLVTANKGTKNLNYDVNKDGIIDNKDLEIYRYAYGNGCKDTGTGQTSLQKTKNSAGKEVAGSCKNSCNKKTKTPDGNCYCDTYSVTNEGDFCIDMDIECPNTWKHQNNKFKKG